MALKHSKKEIRAVGLQGKNYNLRRQYEKETKGGKYAIFMSVGVIENSSLAKLNEMIINIMSVRCRRERVPLLAWWLIFSFLPYR